ncbi:MAG: ABC transporter ATP-binding protein [Gammaproteobacteria bacterium]|nr:ABC transporter ATP-binding protein [Gammaproteobacteria bacterium]
MLKVKLQQTRPALLDVELSCEKGEVLALVGPSGAGKSTVLRCIAGLQSPQHGLISCKGHTWFDSDEKVKQTPQQRRVGMVFQNYALFPHLTVMENIKLALDSDKSAHHEHGKHLLEQVNLSGLEQRYPHQLSGGQQQRVAIARALARQPEVLLLDEPFSAVDKVTRRKLYLELNTLRRQLDMPVILVTHDLDEAAMLADSLCVIHQGVTLQQGSPEEVLFRPDNVAIARQVDARNVFSGHLVEHENTLKLKWYEHFIEIASTSGFRAGQHVYWTLSPSKVLLHQRVRKSRGDHENPLIGTICEMVNLRGITTLILKIEHTNGINLQMDLPEHVAMRNGLKIGETISVSLLADAIHLMTE